MGILEPIANMNFTRKFCLTWDDFRDLWQDTDLSDVTLVGEGNTQIKTHKVILAVSSPLFNDMLKKNKHPHPLIYMRGIKEKYLVSIVDFIYHGETQISQDDLEDFLNIAEEIQLKGLRGGGNVSGKHNYIESTSSSPQGLPNEQNSKIDKNISFCDSINKDDYYIK